MYVLFREEIEDRTHQLHYLDYTVQCIKCVSYCTSTGSISIKKTGLLHFATHVKLSLSLMVRHVRRMVESRSTATLYSSSCQLIFSHLFRMFGINSECPFAQLSTLTVLAVLSAIAHRTLHDLHSEYCFDFILHCRPLNQP